MNAVTALERAVEALTRDAAAQPGEYEADLPRIRAAEYALLGLRDQVSGACNEARRAALHRATQGLVEKHMEGIQ